MELDFDAEARARLEERVEALGGMYSDDHDNPTVSVDEFFTGNRDLGSIGCNPRKHPGIETFHRVLKGIEGKPGVSGVYVRITDLEGDDAWPFSDTVLINTSAEQGEVESWVRELSPDVVGPMNDEGLARLHAETPRPKAGERMYVVWWD